MNLKSYFIILIILSLITSLSFAFCGGIGTIANPYLICTPDHLNNVRNDMNAHYRLNNSIDMNVAPYNTGAGWEPIGEIDWGDFVNSDFFYGTFDGDGHIIYNLYINRPSMDGVGLFSISEVFAPVEIYNVGLVNVEIIGQNYVGGLIGWHLSEIGTISESFVTGEIKGNNNVGGLTGFSNSEISNSYAKVDVEGNDRVGGLVGDNNNGTVLNSYSDGMVMGDTNVGGLIGVSTGNITNSFYNNETSGQSDTGKGVPLPTEDMRAALVFGFGGWNINVVDYDEVNTGYIWNIVNGQTEPFLSWEGAKETPFCGGTGTSGNPYLICTPKNLYNVRNHFYAHYKLNNSIDLDHTILSDELWYNPRTGWDPIGKIGTSWLNGKISFAGVFDGDGYTIENVYINRPDREAVGLFGSTNYFSSEIKNLGVKNVDITGKNNVGGLVGLYGGDFISNTYTTGSIQGENGIGGIMGTGLSGEIKNSYSEANVLGEDYLGGLVGTSQIDINNSYSTGSVSSTGSPEFMGGAIGSKTGGDVNNVFYDSQTSGRSDNDGRGVPRTTNQMQDISTYEATWNIVQKELYETTIDWWIDDGNDYPRLFWEYTYTFTDGNGSKNNPYIIYTVEDLYNVRTKLDAHYILNNSLDLNVAPYNANEGWRPIGTFDLGDHSKAFSGSLEGNGHTINNLYINRPGIHHVGLFGHSRNANFSNLNLENIDITAGGIIGGLIGDVSEVNINNCKIHGNIEAAGGTGNYLGGLIGGGGGQINIFNSSTNVTINNGNFYLGGFIGRSINNIEIINSFSVGEITGLNDIGGFIGKSINTTIEKSYSEVNVIGTSNLGGLVGYMSSSLILLGLNNTYAEGNITGESNMGGLIGNLDQGRVSNSYSIGLITNSSSSNVGGLIGTSWGVVSNSFWDVETSNTLTSDAGTGKTTEEMQNLTTFTTATWNIVSIYDYNDETWYLFEEVDYPRLGWEYSTPPFCGGAGTIGNPYLICTPENLDNVRLDLTAHYKLNNSIDLNVAPYNESAGWWPIGNDTDRFTGTFEGNNYEISNLYINRSGNSYVGLFGHIQEGNISDIKLYNINITGRNYVGGLTGVCNNTIITNILINGEIIGNEKIGGLVGFSAWSNLHNISSKIEISGIDEIGGIIGKGEYDNYENLNSTGEIIGNNLIGGLMGGGHYIQIINSNSSINVQGNEYVGGLVGWQNSGNINNSHSTGNINGINEIGGLIGHLNNGEIYDSYATGNVSGNNLVGGLVGYLGSSEMYNSYATGKIIGTENRIGGLIGYLSGSEIHNSYATGDVSGSQQSGGLVGSAVTNSKLNGTYATGDVSGSARSGGLVGNLESSGIHNSYATGNIDGTTGVGGLAGYIWGSTIDYSYSRGKVTGLLNFGGLVGYTSTSEVKNSFYDVITSGQNDDDGRGVPKYTYKMFVLTTFTDETWNMVGVNSKETNEDYIWNVIDGKTYPFLSWEEPREVVWDSIIYPQGIYEPLNLTAPGARLSTFNITFVNLNATASDEFSCLIEQSNGNVIDLRDSPSFDLTNQNFTLSYTILSGENITKTTPWKILECSFYRDGNLTFTDYGRYNLLYHNNYYNPKPILIREDNVWTKFSTTNDDAYRATFCFLGFSGIYFNNTLRCDYVGDVAFAASLAEGFNMDRICADCEDRYCQGIAYSCKPHDYIGDDHANTCVNGVCTATRNIGGKTITYSYNRYVEPDGSLKVRFRSANHNDARPIMYAITNLENDDYSTKSGKYNNTYENTFYLDTFETTTTSIVAEAPEGYVGDIDFVMWVNLSSTNYPEGDYVFSVHLIHYGADLLINNIQIHVNSSAPSVWNESDTGLGRTNPCMSDVDEDFDYRTSCADSDCWGLQGGINAYTDEPAYCAEFEICDDGFDNTRSGLTDCEELSCDLENALPFPTYHHPSDPSPSDPSIPIKCHYQGEGNDTYDGGTYDWILACTDGFNNDAEDGWDSSILGVGGNVDCWDTTFCWGRGGTSTTLPCPEFENNTASWCFDGYDNNYDGLIDCDNTQCLGVDFIVDEDFLLSYNETYYEERYNRTPVLGEYLICSTEEPINRFNETEPFRCFDGIDNNFDGLFDCADPTCIGIMYEGNICVENEFDLDAWLANFKQNTLLVNIHYCADGIDNDGDEDIDCRDSDCKQKFGYCGPCPSYEFYRWNSCADGVDNNLDGEIDCASPECDGQIGSLVSSQLCAAEEICDDGFDNTGDGRVDCQSPSCWGQQGPQNQTCAEHEDTDLLCSDGYDNTGDGIIDCMNPSCWDTDACAEKDWDTVGNIDVPHTTDWTRIGETSIEYRNLQNHYVNTDYVLQITGSGDEYDSITITIGSATGVNFPYDATICILTGDIDKVKWVSTQEEVGQLQNVDPVTTGGFTVTLTCDGLGSPVTNTPYPISVTNEVDGSPETGEVTLPTRVFENDAPSILGYETAPNISGTVTIVKGGNLGVRGIPENDVSGISRCWFKLEGDNYIEEDYTNGDCLYTFENIIESGEYNLSIRARDGVSNIGDWEEYSFEIVVLPKFNSIEISDIGNAYPFFNSTEGNVTVEFTSQVTSSVNKEITSCVAYLEDELGEVVYSENIDITPSETVNCNGNFTIDLLDEGKYHVYVIAKDEDDNEITSNKKVFFNCPTYGDDYIGCEMADFEMDGYRDIGDDDLGTCDFYVNQDIIITIESPEEGKIYSSRDQLVNITVETYNFNSVWYNWNGTDKEYTGEEIVRFDWGEITLHVWANDLLGNVNYTNVTFRTQAPSGTSKSNPRLNYGFDDVKRLLEVESEKNIEIRLMSLVDYSTFSGITDDDGMIEFNVENEGDYKLIAVSNDEYNQREETISLRFSTGPTDEEEEEEICYPEHRGYIKLVEDWPECVYECGISEDDCPEGQELINTGIECYCIMIEDDIDEDDEIDDPDRPGEPIDLGIPMELNILSRYEEGVCQYETFVVKIESENENCTTNLNIRIPEEGINEMFSDEKEIRVDEVGFITIFVSKEGCAPIQERIQILNCTDEDFQPIIHEDRDIFTEIFNEINEIMRTSIKSGCEGFYFEGLPMIFCDLVWVIIFSGSLLAAFLEPVKGKKLLYFILPPLLSVLLIPVIGAVSIVVTIYLSYRSYLEKRLEEKREEKEMTEEIKK